MSFLVAWGPLSPGAMLELVVVAVGGLWWSVVVVAVGAAGLPLVVVVVVVVPFPVPSLWF